MALNVAQDVLDSPGAPPAAPAPAGVPRFTRALLINPPTGLYRRDDRCQCKVEDQTVQIIFPPIELASLAAVLMARGVTARIEDYPARRATWDDYVTDLKSFQPDMVLVNVTTATSRQDFEALTAAKDALGTQAVLTLAKGEYMEAKGTEALDEHPEIDLGFHGEIEEVLQALQRGDKLDSIPGLIWRRTSAPDGGASERGIGMVGTPERNAGHPLIENLDQYPFPARDLMNNALYRSPETGNMLTVVHGNRGCSAKCIFCPAGSMSGYRIRYRTPENVVREVQECVEKYGIREFLFHGDTFTINKKWLIELCDRIIAAKLDIHWGCNSRVDTMTDDRAAKMKQAGCWVVAFGIETGNQEIMDRMKKGQQVVRAEEAIAICKRNGLRTHAFCVIGTPWETKATLEQTYRFILKLDPDFFDFNISYPLPGTELYDIVMREGLFEQAPDATGYANAAVRSFELSSNELTEWRRKHLLKLYLRPRYIARMLYRAGSPRIAWQYFKAGKKRLRQLVSAA